MRILYAEDERDLNDLVTRRLVAEGYGVDSCLDGQQAWDYLQAADYDAAILDIMMPHLDGLSVLKKLRAAGKTTPVLLLTARAAVQPGHAVGDGVALLLCPFRHGDFLPRHSRCSSLPL